MDEIKLWFSWGWVAVCNFPMYSLGKTKMTEYVVFWRTGHCLHFDNPRGLPRIQRYG